MRVNTSAIIARPLTKAWTMRLGPGWILPVCLLIVWDISVRVGLLDPLFWASPESVVAAAATQARSGALWGDFITSLQRALAGFSIGAALGLIVGLSTGRAPLLSQLLNPSINSVRQIAIFAWIPLLSLWLGSGELAKIVFVALAAFFPVALNSYEGAAGIERRYFDVAQLFKLTRWQSLRLLTIPAAMPSVITGVRLGLIYAWLATIGSEYFFTGGAGLGNAMNDGRQQFHMDQVIMGMAIIGAVGFAMSASARLLERRVARWRGA
jgi:sulfonate transport system permease protein